jgi:hypothetical protein
MGRGVSVWHWCAAFNTADIIIIITTIIIIKALSVSLSLCLCLCFSPDKEVAQGLFYLPQSSKEEVLELDHQDQTSGGGEEANFQNLVYSK